MDKKIISKRAQVQKWKARSSAEVKTFAKAAKTFSGKATISKSAARKTLIDLGINTKAGRLTKRYR
jgi:hypothetical protein